MSKNNTIRNKSNIFIDEFAYQIIKEHECNCKLNIKTINIKESKNV